MWDIQHPQHSRSRGNGNKLMMDDYLILVRYWELDTAPGIHQHISKGERGDTVQSIFYKPLQTSSANVPFGLKGNLD